MARPITAYEARDGSLFKTKEAANLHDDIVVLTSWCRTYVSEEVAPQLAEAMCRAKEFNIVVYHDPITTNGGHK